MITSSQHRAQRALFLRCLVAFGILSVLAISVAAGAASGPVTLPVKMVVPMYTDPTLLWPGISNASSAVGMVILNPAVAQRFNYSASFATFVQTAHSYGIEVLGYVPSDYDNGVVPLNYSEELMSDYASWYHVDGYFVDEVNTTCLPAPLAYYTSVSDFARQQPGSHIVIMNLGGDAGSCYLSLANIFVTFENSYSAYVNDAPPSWGGSLPSSDFLNLVYDVPNTTAMQNAINLAMSRNVGWVYMTDQGSSGNPYAGLPTFMQQEAAYLDSLATVEAQQPTQTSSGSSSTTVSSSTTASSTTLSTTSASVDSASSRVNAVKSPYVTGVQSSSGTVNFTGDYGAGNATATTTSTTVPGPNQVQQSGSTASSGIPPNMIVTIALVSAMGVSFGVALYVRRRGGVPEDVGEEPW
jgi:Spherulation-specific family 4